MEFKEKFDTFEELFRYAVLFSALPERIENKAHTEFLESYYATLFSFWLQEQKGKKFNNNEDYKNALTKSNWIEFVDHYKQKEIDNRKSFDQEQITWQSQNSASVQNSNEIFIVEELENLLAIEAVLYQKKCDEHWQEYKFDPTYFDSFISGPLLTKFTKSIYDRLSPLNDREINRYLNLSLQQFASHTPPTRHKAFLLNYHNTYWFPNVMEYKGNEYDVKYATHVWKHYTIHFNLLKEAFQKIYDDYKSNTKNDMTELNSGVTNRMTNMLKSLEYNYALYTSPLEQYHLWQTNLDNFKTELFDRLMTLPADKHKAFLKYTYNSFAELLKHCHTSKEELAELYDKYETNEGFVIYSSTIDDKLKIILNKELPDDSDTIKEDYDQDEVDAQYTFYNYYYGKVIRDVLNYTIQQAQDFNIELNHPTQDLNQTGKINSKNKPYSPIKAKSFTYIELNSGLENVTALQNELIKLKLINSNTELKHFRKIFSGKEIEQKISWLGNISELAHFIKTLHNTAKKVQDTKQKQWEITINCFEMFDGTVLTNQKLKQQKTPASAPIIEKAINIL